jgi:hypothetical protein
LEFEGVKPKIILKRFTFALALVVITIMMEFVLLRTLPVYNTTIGTFLLARDLLLHSAILVFASLVLLYFVGFFRNSLVLGVCYFLTGVGCLASFVFQMNNGLGMDVTYTWVLNKSGLDILKLQYLGGWSIAFIFILAALLFLSDPRLSYEKGNDGKRHLYVHSKLIGLIRWVVTEQRIGENPDFPVVAKIEKYEVERERYSGKHFNDKVRVFSWYYGIWASVKLLIGLSVASVLASPIALRYIMIQNYLEKTGSTWLELARKFMEIAWMRFTGVINVPVNFPIDEAITFEVFKFFEPLIFYFCVVWIVRLAFALIGERLTYVIENDRAVSTRHILTNASLIPALAIVPFILRIPGWVFEWTTPYVAWEIIIWFSALIFLALIFRFFVKFPQLKAVSERMISWLTRNGPIRRIIKAAATFGLILLMFSPVLTSAIFIQPYMEGRRYEYVWSPAYLPTIGFTRWAYEIDTIHRIDSAAITSPETEVLKEVRIFTKEAAKLNMKPHVGVNWLSIDQSDVDIVYLNGTEYWVSLLTLIRPPYPGDVDVWRADHLILTHSEKILATDASTTEMVDIRQILKLEETPRIYYGEGGLWEDVDEIYLHIPGFSETHLPEYQGPPSYDDAADYTYRGFWRLWKFSLMWRFDFARGDYGDINALVNRDAGERVSKILLPEMKMEPDAYPVVDDEGNIYLLYWVWIDWSPPHEFCDYPEHTLNEIYRKFAVVLVNVKNGEVDGYLMNKEREDYVLSFHRSFYSQWDKPVPRWLQRQLRYPEGFFGKQIEAYNSYFQDDFEKWQRNEFYELTMGDDGKPIEEVRYILMPVNGKLTWVAARIVEWYKGATRNLAGIYVALGGEEIGKVYFVDFEGKTVIGPSIAISTVRGNPELTRHPYFPQWKSGNILMYSLGSQLYYVIPYYKEEATILLPQMVAVVNAFDQSTGFYIIQNPMDPKEVSMAATNAFQMVGVKIVEEIEINGTLNEKYDYVESGNTRWLLNIKLYNGTILDLIAKAEMLSPEDIAKIMHLKNGDSIAVLIDENRVVIKFLSS